MSATRQELEAQIATCRDSEQLKELAKQLMALNGASNHFRADVSVREEPTPTPAPPVDSGGHLMRIFCVVNDRYEVFASSEAGLDEKERQIRALVTR